MRLLSILIGLVVASTHAQADSWVQIGPLARATASATLDPDDPTSIFAGYLYWDAVLFHSSDAGTAWSRLSPPNLAIVFAPSNHNVAYAYGGYTVHKSVDGGLNWVQQSLFRTGPLAVDPNDENHLYAGSSNDMGYPQFCSSTDGGATWNCSTPSGFVGGYPSSIVIDPRDGNVAYVAMAGDFDNPSSGIYKTVNGGATWVNVSQASFYGEVSCLAMNPSNPDVLFAGTIYGGFAPRGILKSINAGATWVASTAGIPNYTDISDIAIDPLHSDIVYAAAGGLYRSVNQGAQWTRMLSAPNCGGIDLLASNPDVICLSTDTGIYLSQDAGVQFSLLGAPPIDQSAVLVDRTNGNVLYAAGDDAMKSTDRGVHWSSSLGGGNRSRAIAQDPNNAFPIYYGGFDFGPVIPNYTPPVIPNSVIWKNFAPSLRDVAVNDIEVARTNANVVYGGGFQRVNVGGIFRSLDAGAHWTTVSSLPTNGLAIDPMNAAVVYIASDAGMYKTIDGGATFLPITNGLNQPSSGRVLEVEIDPMHPQTVYGSTSVQGLFKSNDGGASWAPLSGPASNCQGIAIDPTDSQIVYASSWNGSVYVTVDGGATWHALGASIVGGECLILDPTNRNTIYSVLDGIWRYERTTQAATPDVVSHTPEVVDLSSCEACALSFSVDTDDDYSQVGAIVLEHMEDDVWVQVDQISGVVPPPVWELEYLVDPDDGPGLHSFRFVARGVDGSRAVSETVAVSFSQGPTPTTFSRVESVYKSGRVLLNWSVVDGPELDGFNVYRQDGASAFRRLNTQLVPANASQFIDDTIVAGTLYTYRVGAVAGDDELMSAPTTLSIPTYGLELGQNHPNPFNPTTTIEYTLPMPERVAIAIYDANGSLVMRLDQGLRSSGTHKTQWDGKDSMGRAVASGVYFYRLDASGRVGTRKMTLLK